MIKQNKCFADKRFIRRYQNSVWLLSILVGTELAYPGISNVMECRTAKTTATKLNVVIMSNFYYYQNIAISKKDLTVCWAALCKLCVSSKLHFSNSSESWTIVQPL